jgi:hypothetical protein
VEQQGELALAQQLRQLSGGRKRAGSQSCQRQSVGLSVEGDTVMGCPLVVISAAKREPETRRSFARTASSICICPSPMTIPLPCDTADPFLSLP